MSDSDLFSTIVDDQSGQIHYSSSWIPLYPAPTTKNSTVTLTTTPGSSFSFSFTGAGIVVYGTYLPLNGSTTSTAATYSIDGAPPFTNTNPTIQQEADNQVFWDSGLIKNGDHTLSVVVTAVNENSAYVIDYLAVVSKDASSSSTSASIPTSSTAVSVSRSKSSSPVGAIVGGVVGGVVFLALIVIALFFFLRRRRDGKPYFYTSATAGDLLTNEIKPYSDMDDSGASQTARISQLPIVPSSVGTPSESSAPLQHAPPIVQAPPSEAGFSSYSASNSGYLSNGAPSSMLTVANPTTMPRITASPNQPRSKAAEAGLLSTPQTYAVFADSGIRFDQYGKPITSSSASGSGSRNPAEEVTGQTEVPPEYSEA
ncbi:hypothetical protein ABKN59_003646 [Abortiporus biennis]